MTSLFYLPSLLGQCRVLQLTSELTHPRTLPTRSSFRQFSEPLAVGDHIRQKLDRSECHNQIPDTHWWCHYSLNHFRCDVSLLLRQSPPPSPLIHLPHLNMLPIPCFGETSLACFTLLLLSTSFPCVIWYQSSLPADGSPSTTGICHNLPLPGLNPPGLRPCDNHHLPTLQAYWDRSIESCRFSTVNRSQLPDFPRVIVTPYPKHTLTPPNPANIQLSKAWPWPKVFKTNY